MRAAALVLTIAAAGCYNPSLQPCQIACANNACPDGLVCNEQNACALTRTTLCSELPIDAAIDGSNPNADGVTIEVRDRMGGPFAAAQVIFMDSGGVVVAEMPTGPDGLASVDMLPGGSVTVIRPIPRLNMAAGTDTSVTTYLDLWPGAHIISQAEFDATARTVNLTLNPPNGTSAFAIYASCRASVSPGSPPTNIAIQIPNRCPTFDLIATAINPSSPTGLFGAFLGGQTGGSISIPSASWQPLSGLGGNLSGLPGNSFTRVYDVRGSVTGLPWSTTPLGSATLAAGGTAPINISQIPMGISIGPQLTLTYQPAIGGPQSRQIVSDRPAPLTTANRDYNGTLMDWVGHPSTDLATRKVTWPFYVPINTAAASPSFFTAVVSFQDDAVAQTAVIWRLIGSPSRITAAGSIKSLVYPDFPGNRMFEPTSSQVVNSSTVTLYNVETGTEHDMIQTLEPEGIDFGYFKIPALRHVTISIGQ